MSDVNAGVPTADREFGEWLYRELIADVHREETGWAPHEPLRGPPGQSLVRQIALRTLVTHLTDGS